MEQQHNWPMRGHTVPGTAGIGRATALGLATMGHTWRSRGVGEYLVVKGCEPATVTATSDR